MKSILFSILFFSSTLAFAQLDEITAIPEAIVQANDLGVTPTAMKGAVKEMVKEQTPPKQAEKPLKEAIQPQPKKQSATDAEKLAYKKGVDDAKKFYESKKQKEIEEQKKKNITMVGELELLKTPTITTSIGFVPGHDTGKTVKDKQNEVTINFGANMLRKSVDSSVLKHINLLSIGFNITSHADINLFTSPINFTFQNGINTGVGFQFDRDDVRGGATILMIGAEF